MIISQVCQDFNVKNPVKRKKPKIHPRRHMRREENAYIRETPSWAIGGMTRIIYIFRLDKTRNFIYTINKKQAKGPFYKYD